MSYRPAVEEVLPESFPLCDTVVWHCTAYTGTEGSRTAGWGSQVTQVSTDFPSHFATTSDRCAALLRCFYAVIVRCQLRESRVQNLTLILFQDEY